MKFLTFGITLLIAVYTIPCLGQSIKKQGYLVLNNGDTLRGWMNYKNWQRNPSHITFFSDSLSTSGSDYKTEDVQSAEITGADQYIRATVKKDDRPVKFSDLLNDNTEMSTTAVVLLRVLVTGSEFSLYELFDFKYHYFIKKPGEEMYELIYTAINNENTLVIQKAFTQQLKACLAAVNAPVELLKEIDKAEYGEKDLKHIVAEMNKLSGAVEYVSHSNEKKLLISYFVGLGGGISTLKFSGTNQQIGLLHFKNGFVPYATAGIDISTARNLQDVTFRAEICYSAASYEGSGSRRVAGANTETYMYTYSIKQTSISPSVSILYNFIRKATTKVYAGLGVSYNFSFYSKNRYTVTSSTTGPKDANDEFLDFPTGWISVNGKLGAKINKNWETGLSWQFLGSCTNYSLFGLTPNSYTFQVRYHF